MKSSQVDKLRKLTTSDRKCITCSYLLLTILILQVLLSSFIIEIDAHRIHIPLKYKRKIKYGVKLAAGVGILATKKAWIPIPLPIPIPIPIFKSYQPILVKKKLWHFGGFGGGLGFGGLHGGLGLGGYGLGGYG